ncbi:tetratricopeptide repeat protein [Streptomyces sp. NBC_00304]|uniref:tetratricopeptide repeat protein n=1 Tax=Streptomyces sp. NBC_00304 TaxID=2975706 RepID=UPI002E2CDAF9|nr:tetratricopeptide repeat protein [Streptomyces sp. NBC_00304]
MTEDIQARGEALVVAARAGDSKGARRGTDFFVSGKHIDEGIPFWEQAVAAGDAFSHYTLARYRKIRGDRSAADALYRAVADRHPDCAYGLGVLLKEDGDPAAAEWFRRGWENGRHLDCKIELGKLMAAEGRVAEASAFLMSDIQLGDIAVFGWSQLFDSVREAFDRAAAALDAAGDDEDGVAVVEALEALSEVDRHFADYPGLTTEADALYRRASVLSAQAAKRYAVFLTETGGEESWPPARDLLRRAYEDRCEEAGYLLGVGHEQRGELDDAERWYLLVAAWGKESPRWNLGFLYLRQGRYDDAERWFREIGEDNEDAAEQLARIAAIRAGDPVRPDEEDLSRLSGLRERAVAGDARASYEYAAILNDWRGANARYLLRWMEPAAAVGDAEAAYEVARLYAVLRGFPASDAWHRKAAEGGHPRACNHMGRFSEAHRDYQEAERWYVRAADAGSPVDLMLAGKLKAQRGAYAEAEPFLRRAWEKDAGAVHRTEAAGYYGLVLHRLGRSQEALEPLEVAVGRWEEDVSRRYDPDDPDLRSRTVRPKKVLEEVKAALSA